MLIHNYICSYNYISKQWGRNDTIHRSINRVDWYLSIEVPLSINLLVDELGYNSIIDFYGIVNGYNATICAFV